MNLRAGISCMLLITVLAAAAQPAPADKNAKAQPSKVVDTGSYGVFMNGRRIATESFQIEQRPNLSVATSELQIDDGNLQASQKSELHLAANGDLRSYRWQELAPGKAETVVEGGDVFMVEKITMGSNKVQELTHMLPPSTVILDDHFFTHRQILLWRYMAGGDCKQAASGMECQLTPVKFGVFVPRQHASAVVELAYAGRERVSLGGVERELSRFNMQADGTEWAMWVDDQHRLVRIVVASERVEILRD